MAKWLVEVAELPQYEQAFRQQHLDGSGLLRLTTDLRGRDEIHKVLGITDRVHRTQLLAAIRKLELANCRRRELEGPPHPPTAAWTALRGLLTRFVPGRSRAADWDAERGESPALVEADDVHTRYDFGYCLRPLNHHLNEHERTLFRAIVPRY